MTNEQKVWAYHDLFARKSSRWPWVNLWRAIQAWRWWHQTFGSFK